MIRRGGQLSVGPFGDFTRRNMSTAPRGPIRFGPFEVTSQVFLTTPHSFALVNIKPLIPGHVLVVPHKPYRRLTELSALELTDLFQSVQRVQRMLARHYFRDSSSVQQHSNAKDGNDKTQPAPGTPEAGSFNIAIQDGSEAGQTVPHVHVHVIPRIRGKTEKPDDGPGDAIYELMAAEEGNVGGHLWDRWAEQRPKPGGKFPRIEDADRQARTLQEMEEEAEVLRRVLQEMESGQESEGNS